MTKLHVSAKQIQAGFYLFIFFNVFLTATVFGRFFENTSVIVYNRTVYPAQF